MTAAPSLIERLCRNLAFHLVEGETIFKALAGQRAAGGGQADIRGGPPI